MPILAVSRLHLIDPSSIEHKCLFLALPLSLWLYVQNIFAAFRLNSFRRCLCDNPALMMTVLCWRKTTSRGWRVFYVCSYDEELAQSDVLIQDARGRLAANASFFGTAPSSRSSRPEPGTRKPISTSWKWPPTPLFTFAGHVTVTSRRRLPSPKKLGVSLPFCV